MTCRPVWARQSRMPFKLFSRKPEPVPPAPEPEPSALDVFTKPDSLAIDKARQDHLASLGLDLEGKTVLEVGAGIGLHTQFFLDRGCAITITDGDPANVAAIQERYPAQDVRTLNL